MQKENLNFAVIQLGARLHYAVPEVLSKAGMLAAVYTDASYETASRAPLKWIPEGLRPRGLRRLTARKLPAAIPVEKVHSYLWPSVTDQLFARFAGRWKKSAHLSHKLGIAGHNLAKQAIRDNFGGANALYVHPCTSTDAIREAKKRGLFVVLEAISHPFLRVYERLECEKFGVPVPPAAQEKLVQPNLKIFKYEANLADLVLAASPYVKGGLEEIGILRHKIRTVPYGLGEQFFQSPPEPQTGRVLFVGSVGYLKGVPYLAEAANQLKADGFKGEIRVVGPLEPGVKGRPEFAGLNYLGQVPRSEVKQEFLKADLFVFPTLSDGFGIVLLEALAAGLPIICTPNCANVVQDGVNGFVVPPRDASALARRIMEITTNRSLRARLSTEASRVAADYTLTRYRERLLEVLLAADQPVTI